MLLSITTEHVYREETTIFDQMKMIHDAGFRGIDFTACRYIDPKYRYGDTAFFSDDWKSWIREIKAWGDAHGVTFTQTHNLTHNYLATDQDSVFLNSMVDRVLEACEMLGIPATVMHPAVPVGKSGCIEECLEANARFFKQKAKVAAEHNVKLCIENLIITQHFDQPQQWRCCHTPDQLVKVVDMIDEPNVGFCLDTGHAHYMGEDIYQSVLRYGERLYALHVHDNNRYFDHHLMPYHGTLDWDSLLRGLADINYQGAFNYESFRATFSLPVEHQPLMLRQLYEIGTKMIQTLEGYQKC